MNIKFNNDWHRWFAWYPVPMGDGSYYAWWRPVARRTGWITDGFNDAPYREYEELVILSARDRDAE
jgi:hypothetical protein